MKAELCTPEIIGTVTTDPREPGEQYTIEHGNGVKESRIVVRVTPNTDVLEGTFSEMSQLILRTNAPDPRTLSCAVCNEPVGDRQWDWAAMCENGPVHAECFMSDVELRAKLDDVGESCDCLLYCDGINNCHIVRDQAGGPHVIYHY